MANERRVGRSHGIEQFSGVMTVLFKTAKQAHELRSEQHKEIIHRCQHEQPDQMRRQMGQLLGRIRACLPAVPET